MDKKTQGVLQTASQAYLNKAIAEVENTNSDEEMDEAVKALKTLIETEKNGEKKLEIRVYPKKRLHAKLYIFRNPPDAANRGHVIVGSSNFSEAGLE